MPKTVQKHGKINPRTMLRYKNNLYRKSLIQIVKQSKLDKIARLKETQSKPMSSIESQQKLSANPVTL